MTRAHPHLPPVVHANLTSTAAAGAPAGIFISPGYIAAELTGPALFIAYFVAAISAFLSSFCYAEFAVRCDSLEFALHAGQACSRR